MHNFLWVKEIESIFIFTMLTGLCTLHCRVHWQHNKRFKQQEMPPTVLGQFLQYTAAILFSLSVECKRLGISESKQIDLCLIWKMVVHLVCKLFLGLAMEEGCPDYGVLDNLLGVLVSL